MIENQREMVLTGQSAAYLPLWQGLQVRYDMDLQKRIGGPYDKDVWKAQKLNFSKRFFVFELIVFWKVKIYT